MVFKELEIQGFKSFPDKVKPEELECVLDILNTL